MSTPIRQVAISYNWTTEERGDSTGKERVAKKQVEDFCSHLLSLGVPVLRDTTGTKQGDDLAEFMRRIGTADYVCVFMSEPYLKSVNCMNELVIAWEHSKHSPGEFERRVHVWVMPSARDLFADNAEFTKQWSDYWINERNRLKVILDEQRTKDLGKGVEQEYERVKAFPEAIDKIFPKLKQTINARKLEELKDWANKEFPPPTPEEEQNQLAEVYAGTVKTMDAILRDFPKVADFISQHCPGVVVAKGNLRLVSDALRLNQFSDIHHFETLAEKLHLFTGSNQDMERLSKFIGGMAVLAVGRDWVLAQRREWFAGCALFPGSDSKYGMDDIAPHFLPLLTHALAGGCVNLNRFFESDEWRNLDDRPTRSKGIGPDEIRESKLYFIDLIVKPDEKNLRLNRSSDEEVGAMFKRIPALLLEARKSGDPYYTTDSKLQPFLHFVRNELSLTDLLLFLPKGGGSSLEDVVTDPVPLFKNLHKIFDFIQNRRGLNPSNAAL